MGDILTISELAVRVYTAYKDAPENYSHISEEVEALRVLIDGAGKHLKSPAISIDEIQRGEKVLKSCQTVLTNLDDLMKEYKSVASTNKRQVFKRIKLGTEDVATLRARLISNTVLLSSFIRRSDASNLLFCVYANISTIAVSLLKHRHA